MNKLQTTPAELVDSRARKLEPTLIKAAERAYCGTGYSVSNALYVITGKSVVVIDTTESLSAARASYSDFRKISALPISYIIYSHFHGDHIRGAKAFHRPGVKVIAQDRMPTELARNNMLLPHRERVNAIQLGTPLPANPGGSISNDPEDGYVPPDILFEEEYRFEEGGTHFELYHTAGESVDHIMVWLPGEKVLFPGDLFYRCFPMLSNPLKADRPVASWVESLERMRKLGAEYLVPSHGPPMQGASEIDATLANYAKAIRHVHDETVKGINEQLSFAEILRRVRLPEELARLPYLKERYGMVRWAVQGIFRQYTGWLDFAPVHLNPCPRRKFARALLQASGGARAFLARAQRGIEAGENQIVLDLTDVVLEIHPRHPRATALRLKALTRLGESGANALERNIYRAAVRELRQRSTSQS